MLLVVPHPLYLTETGVARWPFVCVTWDEIEWFMIGNIGVNRPVMTLQLISKRSALPMLPPHTGIRLTEEDVQDIRQVMEQKGVPEYPYWHCSGLVERLDTARPDAPHHPVEPTVAPPEIHNSASIFFVPAS